MLKTKYNTNQVDVFYHFLYFFILCICFCIILNYSKNKKVQDSSFLCYFRINHILFKVKMIDIIVHLLFVIYLKIKIFFSILNELFQAFYI